jgi:lipoprotein-releasing system permease protein
MNRWLPFEWIAAIRFLLDGKLQTLFIIVGISIGVGVIVFMSAMLTGLQANFIKRILTSQAQIQILPPDQLARRQRTGSNDIEDAIIQRPSQRLVSIDQWQSIAKQLETMPEIAVVAPTATGSALAKRGDASRAITLTGVEPDSYFKVVRVPDYIVQGQPRLLSDDIIIGIELAKNLGASLGDKLNITSSNGGSRILTIVGLLDFGNKGANARITFVSLRTAQSLLGMIGGVATLDLTLKDIYAAEVLARQIQSSNDVIADSWIKTNAEFFTAINAQNLTNMVIRIFVGLSVAFGIAAVLVVSVIQRSRDIGILRAMGCSRGKVLRLFLIQGGVLGFFGSLIGSAIGAFALVWWHAAARQTDGSELFPLVMEAQLFIWTAVLATLTGLIAAMAPALRAAKLDPVVAIRG